MKTSFVVLFFIALPVLALSQNQLTDEQLLKIYNGLRVADVSDGMDMVGLRDAGLMDQRIQAPDKTVSEN